MNGRKIRLNVVVLPALASNRPADPLFYLEGGPGGAGTLETSWAASHFGAFNQRHDIVLIDQRGAGQSNPASCDVPRGMTTEAELAEFAKNCLASVAGKAEPAQYTTPIAADDIDSVRAALGYDKINVYGISYGVTLGLAYIQRHPDRVRTALLDSGSLLDVHIWEQLPRTADNALHRLFDRCRQDAACNRAFPNLPGDFAAVLKRLARGPVQLDISDPVTTANVELDRVNFGGLVIDAYLATAEGIAAFPKAIHAAAHNDWSYISARARDYVTPGDSLSVMRQTITCGDAWASVDPARVAVVSPDSPFTPWEVMFATSQTMACKYWPHAAGASGVVRSSAPVVFLNAVSDPIDPPDNVAGVLDGMPNSLVVAVQGAGHWQLNYDPTGCLAEKTNAFFERGVPSTLADWNCDEAQTAFTI